MHKNSDQEEKESTDGWSADREVHLASLIKASTLASSASLTRIAVDVMRPVLGTAEREAALADIATWASKTEGRWHRALRNSVGLALSVGVHVGSAVDRSLPSNWSADHVTMADLPRISQLAVDMSLPLLWAPRGEVVAELLALDRSDIAQALVDYSEPVSDDIESVLSDISEPRLLTWRTLAYDGLRAARAREWRAAQLLGVAAAGGTLEFAFNISRRDLGKRQPDALGSRISRFRQSLLLSAVATAWEGRGDRDPIPTRLHRHSTMHGASLHQYSATNALTSLLLATGALRELDLPPSKLDSASG